MLKIVHKARHGVLLAQLDERIAVVHRHAREHGDVEDADNAQDDGNGAGNRCFGRNVAKADGRNRLKAKPKSIAKGEGRRLGQPDSRRNTSASVLSFFIATPSTDNQSRSLGIVPQPSVRDVPFVPAERDCPQLPGGAV